MNHNLRVYPDDSRDSSLSFAMPTPVYEAMNRKSLVGEVQKHNDRVQVIRSYSRKSKAELLKELRAVYPLPAVKEKKKRSKKPAKKTPPPPEPQPEPESPHP